MVRCDYFPAKIHILNPANGGLDQMMLPFQLGDFNVPCQNKMSPYQLLHCFYFGIVLLIDFATDTPKPSEGTLMNTDLPSRRWCVESNHAIATLGVPSPN